MRSEPKLKRACAFVDGQNLFHSAKQAFGYSYPNYDPEKLADEVCRQQGWVLERLYFYTGIPNPGDKPSWHKFWSDKLAALGTRKRVNVFSRPLKPRTQTVRLSDGTETTVQTYVEKGIDTRIVIDVLREAIVGEMDVGVLFSQDQDLSEVAKEIRFVSGGFDRWIKLACAYPVAALPTISAGSMARTGSGSIRGCTIGVSILWTTANGSVAPIPQPIGGSRTV